MKPSHLYVKKIELLFPLLEHAIFHDCPERISPKPITNGKFSEVLSGQNSLFLGNQDRMIFKPHTSNTNPQLKKRKKFIPTAKLSHCSFTTQEYFI